MSHLPQPLDHGSGQFSILKLNAFNATPFQVCDVISFENAQKNILQPF
jgi:hypothetical protein